MIKFSITTLIMAFSYVLSAAYISGHVVTASQELVIGLLWSIGVEVVEIRKDKSIKFKISVENNKGGE